MDTSTTYATFSGASTLSLKAAIIGFSFILLLLGGYFLLRPSEGVKRLIFYSSATVIVAVTFLLVGLTVYLNSVSLTKGPVHWHADFEIWACGEKLDLVNPKGFSNKIGTPLLHEHNDGRIHVEGVVLNEDDITLARFFEVIGGQFNKYRLADLPTAQNLTTGEFIDLSGILEIPTNAGSVTFNEKQPCSGDTRAELQTFIYEVHSDKTYSQRKIEAPSDYVLSPASQVPSGDCIIIEFGPVKARTEHLCRSYQTALQTGKLTGDADYAD